MCCLLSSAMPARYLFWSIPITVSEGVSSLKILIRMCLHSPAQSLWNGPSRDFILVPFRVDQLRGKGAEVCEDPKSVPPFAFQWGLWNGGRLGSESITTIVQLDRSSLFYLILDSPCAFEWRGISLQLRWSYWLNSVSWNIDSQVSCESTVGWEPFYGGKSGQNMISQNSRDLCQHAVSDTFSN